MFIFYILRSPDLRLRVLSIMAMAAQITGAGLCFSISYYCSHQCAGSSARVQLVIVLYIIIDTAPCPSHRRLLLPEAFLCPRFWRRRTREEWEGNLEITSHPVDQKNSVRVQSTTPKNESCCDGCRVAVPRSHWSAVPAPLFIYISQLVRDSFSVSQLPPIWEPPSHYSMVPTS